MSKAPKIIIEMPRPGETHSHYILFSALPASAPQLEPHTPIMGTLTTGEAIYIGVAGIFMFLSVFTNFCIIYIVLRKKHMQTVTNIFISNLSASDAFMGGIIVPQMVHDISHTDEYDEGERNVKQ